MEAYIAFFDDSGNPLPDHPSEFYVLGMVIVPLNQVQAINAKVSNLFAHSEVKSSTFLSLRNKLCNGAKVRLNEKEADIIQKLNLIDCASVNAFLSRLYALFKEIISLNHARFIAIAIHKESNLKRFRNSKFMQYLQYKSILDRHSSRKTLSHKTLKKRYERLRKVLTEQILNNALPYLLQRLQYFLDKNNGLAIVLGDENSFQKDMYAAHAMLPAGARNYTTLPRIVNNVVFGSSEFNPGIQVADWVAHAVNRWARSDPILFTRFKRGFRGYPSKIKGYGLILTPDDYGWPPL